MAKTVLKRGKRRYIQLLSAVLYNINFRGFGTGTIYRGKNKGVCVPGLNCYSCPGAIAACPLGALQASLNDLPKVSLYVIGTLLIFGALLGRGICAFLCPFGSIQELLYKIPSPKISKGKWSRRFSGLKYVILVLFVMALPVCFLIKNGVAIPAFCKWICPAGTLEGGIPLVLSNEGLRAQVGSLFGWKLALMLLVLATCIFIYRPFCRFICPLGAIYSLFNRIAIFGVRVDEKKCVHCDACIQKCKLDVKKINDRECIRCGECAKVCPCNAIDFRFFRIKRGNSSKIVIDGFSNLRKEHGKNET